MTEAQDTLWNGLLKAFQEGLEKAIEELQKRDIENIPGAKEALIQRLNNMKLHFPKNNGDILIRSINDKIQNSFFPNTKDFATAFEKILKSRTHEQDFIINELLNGFVSSKAKASSSIWSSTSNSLMAPLRKPNQAAFKPMKLNPASKKKSARGSESII